MEPPFPTTPLSAISDNKKNLQRLVTKWRVRSFRQKKTIQALEKQNEELLKKINQQNHSPHPDLRARRPSDGMARYTEDEEMRALALYFQGPRAYRALQKLYVLPHPRTLRRKMEQIQLKPGFHEEVLALVKAKFSGASDRDKLCVIVFDEMQLRSKLTYQRGEDAIEGYVDHGPVGRSSDCADHALVMMARGVTRNWKQPIGYFLSAGTTRATVQRDLIIKCIQRATAAGLTVIATTCDMSKNNQATYRLLGVKDSGTFTVDGEEIVALYDVPHLFKCIRNAFLKYDITIDGDVASWSYLDSLYALDSAAYPRAAPKLSKQRLKPNSFEKMKVRYALQVMSRTVAAAIKLYAMHGK